MEATGTRFVAPCAPDGAAGGGDEGAAARAGGRGRRVGRHAPRRRTWPSWPGAEANVSNALLSWAAATYGSTGARRTCWAQRPDGARGSGRPARTGASWRWRPPRISARGQALMHVPCRAMGAAAARLHTARASACGPAKARRRYLTFAAPRREANMRSGTDSRWDWRATNCEAALAHYRKVADRGKRGHAWADWPGLGRA